MELVNFIIQGTRVKYSDNRVIIKLNFKKRIDKDASFR